MSDYTAGQIRIVIHAPTAGALERARGNIANIMHDDPQATVELVVNSGGAKAVVEKPEIIDERLRICSNSLRLNNLTAPPDAVVVPNAMLHIAARQMQGWSYIRA